MNSAQLLAEGGSTSFNDEDPGRSATLPWVVPRPGVYGQHKLDSRDYVFNKDRKLVGEGGKV